jgi:hypothetical protein
MRYQWPETPPPFAPPRSPVLTVLLLFFGLIAWWWWPVSPRPIGRHSDGLDRCPDSPTMGIEGDCPDDGDGGGVPVASMPRGDV